MTQQNDKAQNDEKVEVTPINVISRTFGINDEIGDAINSFLNDVIAPTIEKSDTSLIVGAASTAAQMNLHCEDVVAKFDGDKLEQVAASYVIERSLSQSCRDLYKGIEFGDKGIFRAQRQLAAALAKLQTNKGDDVIESQVLGRINWLTQMKCQQVFRTRLFAVSQAQYRVQTGKVWIFDDDAADTAPEIAATDPGTAALMA